MTKKDRAQLKRIGMLEEFDIWKSSLPKEKFKIGTKVRFKKSYEGFPSTVPVGSLGKVVPTNDTYLDGIVEIRVEKIDQSAGFWERELNAFLEKIQRKLSDIKGQSAIEENWNVGGV